MSFISIAWCSKKTVLFNRIVFSLINWKSRNASFFSAQSLRLSACGNFNYTYKPAKRKKFLSKNLGSHGCFLYCWRIKTLSAYFSCALRFVRERKGREKKTGDSFCFFVRFLPSLSKCLLAQAKKTFILGQAFLFNK